ncbi:nickel pincer cofactor biosynthesis protein LarB [uncultured Eubacterium sp.]|uniref:nickel pincer cofactor biosynthesis protein LarB n=1 Tax=uncultured Eubacterium sp. TaxID=165185 RepID=UPI0015A81241|nr:nickel pincer cofactor biosynthesis protein LarB [uncultured Eubacterium sp.]
MKKKDILYILEKVESGELTAESATEALSYKELGFATVDTSRRLRHGACEVIYGEGKTREQIEKIITALFNSGEKTVIITRTDKAKADYLSQKFELFYDEASRLAVAGEMPKPDGKGKIIVCCAGTSDLYCANEAYYTAMALGNEVELISDVGVAGIHRLLDKAEKFENAKAVIAIAGMEGALASVIGGLAPCPVIGVPTSVGYGASFSGVSALLSMLNSCTSNVSVVNIDNGFSAAYIANMINHQE